MTNKQRAAALLRKYDKLRRELRDTEHELARACVAYGREQGYLAGFSKDHLRIQLEHETEKRKVA